MVRVSAQIVLPLTVAAGVSPSLTNYPIPVVFTPSQLPGFADYANTYSEFRVLKAVCKVHLAVDEDEAVGAPLANQPYTYLRVASRPYLEAFATTATGTTSESGGSNPTTLAKILANRQVRITELRQSRWQRQYYPSDIKNSITFKFYPYTLEWQGRPVGNTVTADTTPYNLQYLKYRSGRRWMPMSFLGRSLGSDINGAEINREPGDDVSFIGPYFARLLSTQPDAQALGAFQPTVTLSVWFQFRGQR